MTPQFKPAAGLLLLVGGLVLLASLVVRSGESVFLVDDPPAQWIQLDRELVLKQLEHKQAATIFAAGFELEATRPSSQATLGVTGTVEVFLDEVLLYAAPHAEGPVGQWFTIELPELAPGHHQLIIVVSSAVGPRLMTFNAPELQVYSSENWQAWMPGLPQGQVRTSTDPVWLPIRQQTPTVWQSLGWPALMLLAGCLLAGYLLSDRLHAANASNPQLLSRARWAIHGAWLLLVVASLTQMPEHTRGFDYTAHIEYVQYIATRGALPLAPDGWQMFQAPLFYLLAAVPFRIGLALGDTALAVELVRLVPLFCGFLQLEVAFRLARLVFPERLPEQLILMGIVVFAPMHLYMNQYVGNEPLAAALTSLAVLMLCEFMLKPRCALSARRQLALGAVLGAAILAKVSAVLLAPAALVGLLLLARQQKFSARETWLAAARISAMVVLVCGWFFARNLLELGAPIVNGWSDSRSIDWWQDPGYRTLPDFLRFGFSLINPVFASAFGLWDSLYSSFWFDGYLGSIADYSLRPPWNYSFALPAVWLALLPTMLIGVGIARAGAGTGDRLELPLRFCLFAVVTYLLAIAYLYATLPIYSTAKATYAMGLLPCFAMLAAAGYTSLSRLLWLRPLLAGLMLAWAMFSFLGYLPVAP